MFQIAPVYSHNGKDILMFDMYLDGKWMGSRMRLSACLEFAKRLWQQGRLDNEFSDTYVPKGRIAARVGHDLTS